MGSEIIAAIVGGFIGLAGSSIPLIWATRYDSYKKDIAAHDEYRSWLRGLIPECDHLLSCETELTDLYNLVTITNPIPCPNKKFNSDFLAAARLSVIKHPRSVILFPQLTTAYRDIVQTNEMMHRFERTYEQTMQSQNQLIQLSGILPNTLKALTGVRNSLTELKKLSEEQEELERNNNPRLLCCF